MIRAALIATILLGTLFTARGEALAQEATPMPGVVCDVEPLSEAELTALNASPVAGATPMAMLPMELPEGEAVDAATLNALDETLRLVVACAEMGDLARLLALYSDEYIANIALAPEPEPIVPGQGHDHDHAPSVVETPEAHVGVVPQVEAAVRLPDGRIAARVSAEGLEGTAEIVIFTEARGRWVVDEIHETAPEGPIGGDLPFPVQAAVASAAAQLDIEAESIEVVRYEPVEWPDTSLGCPKEGEAYAAVITPGYRVTLEVNGQELEYHTDEFDRVVRCDDPA